MDIPIVYIQGMSAVVPQDSKKIATFSTRNAKTHSIYLCNPFELLCKYTKVSLTNSTQYLKFLQKSILQ